MNLTVFVAWQEGDTLTVHYEGTLTREGTKFDSSEYDVLNTLQVCLQSMKVCRRVYLSVCCVSLSLSLSLVYVRVSYICIHNLQPFPHAHAHGNLRGAYHT